MFIDSLEYLNTKNLEYLQSCKDANSLLVGVKALTTIKSFILSGTIAWNLR